MRGGVMAKSTQVSSSRRLNRTQKAAIKASQAAFIEKIQTAIANEHQQAIFAAAQSGVGQYVVVAGPGSGKTFTSIKASTFFEGKSVYFSYNKKIQTDTNLKLAAIDSRMYATTAHAFGLSCLIAYLRGKKIKVDDEEEKYHNIVVQYLQDHWKPFLESIQADLEEDEEANVDVMRLDALAWSKTLIHFAQVSLTEPSWDGLVSLVEDFDLVDISISSLHWPFVVNAVRFALKEGLAQFLAPEHFVAFDDMIYFPSIIEGVPVRQYDHVVVDEAQDTSRAALELMLKACHTGSQIFFIGDPLQSIYLFAGADFDSINRIIARLHAQILPLRICYRCGSKIVDLANQLGGELISAGLHTGNVEVIPVDGYLDRLQPGDAILARTTVHLVKGCLKCLQQGKRAKVLGRNLGANIAAVVTKLEAMRIKRGVPALHADLSNLLDVLDVYHKKESKGLTESRKNPDLALAELEDKVETVRALFSAYIRKCNDDSLRVEDDPKCAWSKSAKDFKVYINGLFVEDEGSQNLILFMTAHRAKGGEWESVYIIHTEEFPHPRARSDRQQEQERNLMYVAVTRAIENLYFVGAPFKRLQVPGHEPERPGLTIISYPAANYLEIHPSFPDLDERELTVETAAVVALPDEGIESEPLVEGRISRIAAVEVLCPFCGSICANPSNGSLLITYNLRGHTVVCSACRESCIVPLNAFSLEGDVIAREKPAVSVPNTKIEKRGRTKKERKSAAGRKAKSGQVRQPMQLSLDVLTIQALNVLGVNKSELYEELLQQYEPFLNVWRQLVAAAEAEGIAEEEEEGELDHDEM
jgi:DNA helicase II / ATP-dependent DNA helicase PcrA